MNETQKIRLLVLTPTLQCGGSEKFVSLYSICKKFFKWIEYGNLLKYSALVIAINLPVAAISYYMLSSANLISFNKLLLGFCIYLFVFIAMNRLKKIRIYETRAKKPADWLN